MKHIATAILLLSTIASQATVTVDQVAQYVYPANAPQSASLHFMPDGTSYICKSSDGHRLELFDTATGKALRIVCDIDKTRGDIRLDNIAGYTVSPDGGKLLIYQDSEPIYRRSMRAAYYIYDISRNTLKPLSTAHPLQQAPVFSPDGRMVAFMAQDNNIYIHKTDYGSEVAVTTDGQPNSVINGVPDWTYEEEFSTNRSMVWAPDNSSLAYIKYNEADVPAFGFPLYEGACDPMTQYALYPGEFVYKYPVAGEKNSIVSLHSYDVDTRKTNDIALPGGIGVEYIPSIHFGPEPSQLIATTLNREQNHLEIVKCNPRSTVAETIYRMESDAWIIPEAYENIAYEDDGMVVMDATGGYSHLVRVSYSGQATPLTSGQYDVTAYYGKTADGTRYWQSAQPSPLDRQLNKTDRSGKTQTVGHAFGWSSARFSPTMGHYVLTYSNAQTPTVYTLCASAKDKPLRTLEDNAAYAAKFADAPRREFFTVNSDGNELNCYIYKPVGFDPSKKYPVVMTQYSGPGSQEVKNAWQMDWQCAAARAGFVVACVDGRGTGARGRAFEQIVYKNLGHYETIDQNALLRHLQSLPWVDASHIGICGWSYGGYETLMCASSGAPYAAACAIAPVTSWRYYDTVYAERYMSTPRQNESGYDTSAPINRVGRMKCPLLLIHGTADDNVHLSNTMELTARLINANVAPQMLLFPNMNHSIYGCNTRALVYTRMLNHFEQHLK